MCGRTRIDGCPQVSTVNTVSVKSCFCSKMKVVEAVVDCGREAQEPMSSRSEPSDPITKLPVDVQLQRF